MNKTNKTVTPGDQPPLRAVCAAVQNPLYPTLSSTQEVLDLACSQLPIKYKNDVVALLFTYHNTLLCQQLNEKANDARSQPTQSAQGIPPGPVIL